MRGGVGGQLRRGVAKGAGGRAAVVRTSLRDHSAAAAAAAQRDLQALTVPQLKEIIRNDSVRVNGSLGQKRKAELIDAILEHRTKAGILRTPRGTPSLYTGEGELAPRPAPGRPVVTVIPASISKKVRVDTVNVTETLSVLERGNRPPGRTTAPAAPRLGPRVPQLVKPTAAELEAPGMLSEALEQAPVVIFSKTFCPFCKDVVAIFDKLGLTQAPYVVELDLLQPQRMEALQDYLGEITGARSVPRVFVDGKVIGGADDTIAAHTSGELAKVLIQAGALPKPLPAAPPTILGSSAAQAPPAAPKTTSVLLEDLAKLPSRVNRKISVGPSPRTVPRGDRPAPKLYNGAGELAPVQNNGAVIVAPKGLRHSPVSASSKVDVTQQLQQISNARSRVAVIPKTPAEVEVSTMESSVSAAAPSKPTPTASVPPSTQAGGGGAGGGGSGASAESFFSSFTPPHIVGAAAAAWALGLASMYMNQPKIEDTGPAQSQVTPLSKEIKTLRMESATEEDMAAVVRIVKRLDRIENELASLEKPNPRRDALLKAKKLQGDAAGAGNACDLDRMKRLHSTAAELREVCKAQGAGTEAVISAKVAEVDASEKVEAAAVGLTLGVAGGLLVYGVVTAFGRR